MASGTIPHNGNYGKQGMFMSDTLITDEVTLITSNKNLNTPEFTIPGKYACNSATVGQTLTNVPGNEKLFQLLVYNPHNSDTGALGTANYRYRTRILMPFNGEFFVQLCHCEGSTTIIYEPWKKISVTTVA